MKKQKNWDFIYWLLISVLLILQAIFTFNSMNQIRYEELAESVRNPFWFQNRLMFDGLSGSMSWYGFQTLIYNIFGYHLFTAKIIRLLLACISIYCLASILKKNFGPRDAFLPLLTIGISPTLLYFNVLQTTYGMDLQFLPIYLYLIILIYQNIHKVAANVIFWVLVMIAWLCYPNFFFYLPALGILSFHDLKNGKQKHNKKIKYLLLSFIAFLAPIFVIFLYIKNRQNLIYDSITHSGLFRGGVKSGVDFTIFWPSLQVTIGDLFSRGDSYYFELLKPDFSDKFPIIVVILILFLSFYIYFKQRNLRFYLNLIYITLFLTAFLVHSSGESEFAGLRRASPMLASFYTLYIISWFFIIKYKFRSFWLKKMIIIFFLILPIHHILVYSQNLTFLKAMSPYRDQFWFQLADSPTKSLEILVSNVQKEDLYLACKDKLGREIPCRYQEIYAAVAGSCLWNRLNCHQIFGFDEKSQKFVPLTVDIFGKTF